MTTPDLHALANMPGAGRAFAVLASAGLVGEDPQAPVWCVHLDATVSARAYFEVRAATREEALRIAEDRAADDPGCWDTTDSVDIEGGTAFRKDDP